jgi:circadian clock protein KaiB
MKTKIVKPRAAVGASGNSGQERGVHAASTSAHAKPSKLAGAVVGRTVKRAEARAPRRLAKLWQLRLYVVDSTTKSQTALANLKQFCENHLKGIYRITVIDLLKRPQLAQGDQILAIPTVVRRLPKPVRIILGNLSDIDHLLVGLDLRPANQPR